MSKVNNLSNNPNIIHLDSKGCFHVYEHQGDLSVGHSAAVSEYYAREMHIRRRQVLVELRGNTVITQAGAMQWTLGNVVSQTGIKSVGDVIGKMFSAKVTGESAIKPEYTGTGFLMLEPTYKHIILVNVSEWGSITLEDGMFLACDKTLQLKTVMRNNISSAAAGGEGLFNLALTGNGIVALESRAPIEELYEFVLENDTLKIDGNMAVVWSSSLQFTVEKSSKSILGSAVNGEGLVNVYRGTGRVLMMPT